MPISNPTYVRVVEVQHGKFFPSCRTRELIPKIEHVLYIVTCNYVHKYDNNIYGYFRYDFYIHTLSISLFGFASIQFDIYVIFPQAAEVETEPDRGQQN